ATAIASVLGQAASAGEACQALLAAALQNGGKDKVTVVLARYRIPRGCPPTGVLELMNEVTRILSPLEQGESHAAGQLLPHVYDELRRLAAGKMAHERPSQTLQATALVHEAYVRLVDANQVQHWNSRGHFFAAAAEAMRRILVENARRKQRIKHGG